jgi:hypothetical protein
MIKTTGAEFKAFYADKIAWPEDAWHEGETITVDGEVDDDYDFDIEQIADAAKVTIEGGIVFKDDKATDGPSFEAHFRAWRKRQNTATLSVTVAKAKEAQLRELLKEFGAKFS